MIRLSRHELCIRGWVPIGLKACLEAAGQRTADEDVMMQWIRRYRDRMSVPQETSEGRAAGALHRVLTVSVLGQQFGPISSDRRLQFYYTTSLQHEAQSHRALVSEGRHL